MTKGRICSASHVAQRAFLPVNVTAHVSNSYASFWNQASGADNQDVLEAFLACARWLAL